MPAPEKKLEPKKGPARAASGDEKVWQLNDLEEIQEALEATEVALQGIAAIVTADVVLRINDNVVAAHHDGLKWWVKFGG